MQAAILAIQPAVPPLSFAAWLGGAGMSVCGLLVVQYFPLKALHFAPADFTTLLKHDHIISNKIIAAAVSTPIIIAFWSSMLFIVGIVNYFLEANMGGLRYKILGLIPVSMAIFSTLAILITGEILGRRVKLKVGKIFYYTI